MTGGEYRTAILVGQNRGIKGAVVARVNYDFILIKSDTRTENRHIYDRVGDLDCRKCLRGNLTETLTRDKRVALIFLCTTLGKAHHKDTEKYREVILLALIAQLLLNMRQGYYVNVDTRAELTHLLRKLHYLFLCALGGVGEGLEVERLDLHTALRHHTTCNGRVDSAREKQKSASCTAYRETARTRLLPCSDICVIVTHLDGDCDLGISHVNLYTANGAEHDSANLCRNLGRGERKTLIGALCINLKCTLTKELLGEIFLCKRLDAIHIFIAHCRAVYTDDTENALGALVHSVHIAKIVLRLYINRALLEIYLKNSVAAGTAAKLLYKSGLKILSVCALEHDLAEFTKYNFRVIHL